MLVCTWARDYGITGTGIDLSPLFTEQAKLRAKQLGVADRVTFIHGDAAGFVSNEKVGLAACLGATWIGGGVVGTIELLAKSLHPGGIILIGEPYWLRLPPTEEVARGCLAGSISTFSCFQNFSRLRLLRLRRRGNGSGGPRQLGPIRGGQVAHHAPMA